MDSFPLCGMKTRAGQQGDGTDCNVHGPGKQSQKPAVSQLDVMGHYWVRERRTPPTSSSAQREWELYIQGCQILQHVQSSQSTIFGFS